jgi:hypothetical protein
MTADWWDMYGPRPGEPTRERCWDCRQSHRRDALAPDGVRCVACWLARFRSSEIREDAA